MESIDGLPWRDTKMHRRGREREKETDHKRKEDREKFIADTEC